jgi:cathepsin B
LLRNKITFLKKKFPVKIKKMKYGIFVALAVLATAIAIMNHAEKPVSYADKLRKIAEEINSSNTTWRAEVPSQFLEVTQEQLKRINGLLFSEPPADMPTIKYSEQEIVNAPASFDSRDKWPTCTSISEIRDQSACGSCWAFGAAEAMSDRICIGTNGQKQTRVSTADLVSCCLSCGQGCNGGYLYPTWMYWKYTGVVSGDLYSDKNTCKPYPFPPCAHHTASTTYPACPSQEYPTPSCKKECVAGYPKSYQSDKSFAKHVYNVNGAGNMATEISTNGPIEGAFTVYEDFLTYKSGVYTHQTGQALGGHAIRILGYGTDSGVDYWLIANSWNETWGDNGYFKIKRGTNECGIEGGATAGVV